MYFLMNINDALKYMYTNHRSHIAISNKKVGGKGMTSLARKYFLF